MGQDSLDTLSARDCQKPQQVPRMRLLSIGSQFTGVWLKDASKSSSMEAAFSLVGVPVLVRKAVRLMRGIEVATEGTKFRMSVISVIPLLKVNEFYPLDGSEAANGRRDLRRGCSHGGLQVRSDGVPVLRYRWAEPFAGEGQDEFRLVAPNELHVVSTVTVGDRTESYTNVHIRRVKK